MAEIHQFPRREKVMPDQRKSIGDAVIWIAILGCVLMGLFFTVGLWLWGLGSFVNWVTG